MQILRMRTILFSADNRTISDLPARECVPYPEYSTLLNRTASSMTQLSFGWKPILDYTQKCIHPIHGNFN